MAVKIVFAVILAVISTSAAPAEEKYTTKYDNVDVENVLRNERLLQNYFNCVMGKSKCTPEGEELKKHIPEALDTECRKCSEKQKKWVERVLKHLYEKKQDMFKQLEQKYDSEGKYRKRYRKQAEKAGIKV